MSFGKLYKILHKEVNEIALDAFLDEFPIACGCFDDNCNLIAANKQWLSLFEVEDITGFESILSGCQPCGTSTDEYLHKYISEAKEEGRCQFELQILKPSGESLYLDVIFERKAGDFITAGAHDISKYKTALCMAGEKAHETAYENGGSESDERAMIMLDATPLSCFMVMPIVADKSVNLEPMDCNQAALDLFGFSSKIEAVARFFDIFPKPSKGESIGALDEVYDHIVAALEKGYHRFEYTHTHKNGELIPCEVTLVSVSYMGKTVLACYESDLREVKAVTEKARELNEINEILINSAPFIINVWDDGPNLIATSDQSAKMFGFDEKRQYIERFNELSPEFQPCGTPTAVKIVEVLNKAFDEGYNNFEWMHQTITGEPLPSEITLVRFIRQNKRFLVAYARDLRPIKAAMAKVQQSYEMAQSFIDEAPFFIEIWDDKLNLIECNKTAARMFELTDSDEYMRIFDELSPEFQPCGTPSAEKIMLLVKTAFREGYLHTSWMHLSPDGEPLPCDVTYVRLKREDGDIVVGYNIDMRDTKRREMAENASKAKSSFLSTMSHEIRTPMNAILGITEIHLMNAELDTETREAFSRIYTSGDLLLSIINDILDLSKIEAGKLDLIIKKYEIASFISDTAQLNMMRIGGKQIDFNLFIDENIPTHVLGDELRVKQILNNLLSNAFKYTKKGKVTLTVTSKASDENDENIILILSISDTGEGMTGEQISQLFDEYSRFNESANRSTEGTGLGMSITLNLVQMMKGEIFVDSEPGKGSVFTVHLPQGIAATETIGKEGAENLRLFRSDSRAFMRRAQVTREPMPYGSILIVDDIETNIHVAKGLLVPYKLRIDSVLSGFEAIKKVKSGNVYDIILMDHMMPEMDGIETTKHIRYMGYDKPIVAFTANAIMGQAEIFLENGFDDFVSKPIDVRQLNIVLNKLIRDKHPREVVEAARQQKSSCEPTSEKTKEQSIAPKLAEIFLRDAKKSLGTLESIFNKGALGVGDDLRTYIIHVHGMKSALANIKNLELSNIAARLENLGREEKFEEIVAETPAFLDELRTLIEKLTPEADPAKEMADEATETDEDISYLHEKLLDIRASCEEYDEIVPGEILEELGSKTWSKSIKEFIDAISRHLMLSEFDEIVDAVDRFMG